MEGYVYMGDPVVFPEKHFKNLMNLKIEKEG